ncbi:MAG: single-stranded DNA-binding protein [Treponema sp.]|jgi:single-strand DNA-binding protein|nr:single-stranded DNA-binding protein [Treponema sp.]
MSDVNHVILIGRLTRDAELKYTSTGFAISNFSVAVNRRRKSGEQWIDEANFFDVTLYGKSAESLKTYLIKGKQVAVEGELRQDRWEQEDGQQRSKVVVAANNVQLLGGGGQVQGGNFSGGAGGGNYAPGQASRPSFQGRNGGYEPVPEAGSARQSFGQDNFDTQQPFGAGGEDFAEDIPF